MKDLVESYQQKCGDIAVTSDANELKSLSVDGVAPALAMRPKSDAEVAAIVSWAGEQGVPVVPQGGGTKMCLGGLLDESLEFVTILSGGLDHVPEYDVDNLTITVGSGVRIGDLQKRVAEHRQFLPLDPPAMDAATVGGVLATNASGPRRLLYGSARDIVLGMRVVTPDGKVIKCGGKTVKNVAGYDLSKLFIGSLGTLGMTVEATFRLVPMPTTSRSVLLGFDTLDGVMGAMAGLTASFLIPSAAELLDASAAARLFQRTGLALEGLYFLLILFEGFQDAVEREAGEVLAKHAGKSMEIPKAKEVLVWQEIRDLLPAEGDDIRLKVSVPISKVGEIVASAGEMAAAVVAHAGSGIVYAILPGGCGRPEESIRGLRARAAGLGGSLVVERAPREVKKKVEVWGKVGAAEGIMRAIRQAFDPKGIMNPGRFPV